MSKTLPISEVKARLPELKPFRLDIPTHVAQRIQHLHPDIKKSLKSALRAIAERRKERTA